MIARQLLPLSIRLRLHAFRDIVSLIPETTGMLPRLLDESDCQSIAFQSQQFRIAGDLWRPDQSDTPRPTIILTHGTSRWGRRAALMRVLANLFRQRGYIVLAFDFRGYGQSQDPERADDAAGFDFAHDIIEAVNYLAEMPSVDMQRLAVVGHSFGAGIALEAQRRDPRIGRYVLFGPPRRLGERFFSADAPDRRFMLTRWQHDMNLPFPFDEQVGADVLKQRDIEHHLPRLKTEDHPPLLLVDAAQESERDRMFLQQVAQEIKQPVQYWTSPHTNHYLHTGRVAGRVWYYRETVLPFVDRVDAFLRGSS